MKTIKRNTIQKIKILEALKNTREHPSAEQVYEVVKQSIPSISLATVYRNLNQMYEEGIIKRLEINKEYHYDAFINEHIHFVCINCGSILDLNISGINKKIFAKIKEQTNNEPKSSEIIIYGICEKCKIHEKKK